MPAPFSRRHFLAASAAGASLFSLGALRAAEKADRFGGWPVGIQSYTLRNFNLVETLRHVQGLGLHFIEFFDKHLSPNANEATLAECLKLLKEADIKLAAHGVNSFSKNHDANKKFFEFAKRAGIKNITASPAPDSFESLDKLCAEYDIRIAIHNHGPGDAHYRTLEQMTKALAGHHPNVGACVDTGHVIRAKEDPIKWLREIGPRVFALHIKDDVNQKGGSQNVIIGKGHLDVPELFKTLKEIKFVGDGSISLEYEANPGNPIDDIKQCLTVAEEAIRKVG